MSDDRSELRNDSPAMQLSMSGTFKTLKEIFLQFNFLKSRKYILERIKLGESKMLYVDGKLIFVRRLMDGSLRIAMVYDDNVLVFEL
ncbi:MAG: hypothetical protein QXW39_04355 [Candidatus Bathyarchaeia archaeon]